MLSTPYIALLAERRGGPGDELAAALSAGLGQEFHFQVAYRDQQPQAVLAAAALVLDLAAPDADMAAATLANAPSVFHINTYRQGALRTGWIGSVPRHKDEVNNLLIPAMRDRHEVVMIGEDASPQQLAAFFQQIDVLLLTADRPQQLPVVLGALACGVYPVAVQQGRVAELLQQLAAGRLAGSSGAELHAALNWCADNTDEVRRQGYRQAQALALQGPALPLLAAWRRLLARGLAKAGVQLAARKPRILILADVRGWIFERHAHFLQQQLADAYEIEVGYLDSQVDEDQWDLLYPLEWKLVPEQYIRTPAKWITGIRSHVSWEQYGVPLVGDYLRRYYSMVHVVSERLQGLLAGAHPQLRVLSHGIRLDHFSTSVPMDSTAGAVRVGWAGNSAVPLKGFAQFIEPLGRLPGVSMKYVGYSNNLLDMAAMKGFYEDLDVYVCCSLTEGNNNSLMEAAAMGRAIVTTDVGTVPEYLVDGESALIVPRTLEAFVAAVQRLRDDPALRQRLGAAARESVKKFSWELKLQEHRAFFERALQLAGW